MVEVTECGRRSNQIQTTVVPDEIDVVCMVPLTICTIVGVVWAVDRATREATTATRTRGSMILNDVRRSISTSYCAPNHARGQTAIVHSRKAGEGRQKSKAKQ